MTTQTVNSSTETTQRPDMWRFVRFMEAQREKATNPEHVTMINVIIDHILAEVRDLDLDATMATLVDDCVYHHYGDATIIGPGQRVSDRAGVRLGYDTLMKSGRLAMDKMETVCERFFMNDDTIAWDGPNYALLTGADLAAAGMPVPDGAAENDEFVLEWRAAIFLTFRDGLMVGEDFYHDIPGSLKKLVATMEQDA